MKKRTNVRQQAIGWCAIAFGVVGLALLAVFSFASPVMGQRDLHIGSTVIHLEVADTNAAQRLGLGGRTSLAPDWGMLFVFQTSDIHPFWMKGMHFPIDIIWLNHGVVTEVVTLPSPPNETAAPAAHEPIYPADRVLELNAGMAATLGLTPGVQLVLPR